MYVTCSEATAMSHGLLYFAALTSELCYCCICQGSVLYHYIKDGKMERSEGSSITEGQVSPGSTSLLNILYTNILAVHTDILPLSD